MTALLLARATLMAVSAVCAAPAFAQQERQVEQLADDAQKGATGIKRPEAETSGDRPATPKRSKPDLLIVPIPQSSPTLGAGLTLGAVLFYNPNQSKEPWITGVGGMYTSNKSWGIGAFHSMSLAHDRFRVLGLAGYADVNLKFYGIGPEAGARNASVEIEDKGIMGLLQAQYRIARNLYVGGRFEYLDLTSRLKTNPPRFPDLDPPDLKSTISAIGPVITYDSRDSSLNPSRGAYVTSATMFNLPDIGSDFTYQKTMFAANAYLPVIPGSMLAVRGSLCGVSTGGPFYDLCLYGMSNDLRGYEAGRYRDRASWATQVEWRQHLGGRFGAVFFAGVGGIASDLGELGHSTILPSVGAGLRFRASKATGINLSLDFAMGKDSHAIYFGIGEAF